MSIDQRPSITEYDAEISYKPLAKISISRTLSDAPHYKPINKFKKRRRTLSESIKKIKWKKILGIMLMITSGFFYSLLTAGVKWGSNLGYCAAEILIYRATIQVFGALLQLLFGLICKQNQKKKHSVSLLSTSLPNIQNDLHKIDENIDNKPKIDYLLYFFVVLRGIFGSISTFTYFEATTMLPLGNCVSLKSLTAVLTTFAGWLILKESLSISHFISLILSMIGITLLTQPSFIFNLFGYNTEIGSMTGYYLVISSSFAQTGIYLCIRKAKKANSALLIISAGLSCIILGLIVMFYNKTKWHLFKTYKDILCILSVGLVGYIAQYCMTTGGQLLIAGLASLFRCTDIFWSFIWQVFFFNDNPNILTIFGGFSMFCSVVVVTWDKVKRVRKKSMSIISSKIVKK